MDLLDPPTTSHPVVAVLGQVETSIETLAATPLFTLDTADTSDLLRRLTVLEARVAAVKLSALTHAGTVDVAAQPAPPPPRRGWRTPPAPPAPTRSPRPASPPR